GGRQDDPRAGRRPAARHEGRRVVRRSRGRRGVRRGRAHAPRRARGARRPEAGGRGRAARRAPRRGVRPDTRLRLGPQRGARGRRGGRRARDRDVRPVRAAPARAAVLPARGARPVLRRGAARAPRGRTHGVARACRGKAPPRRADGERRARGGAARRAARARRGHRRLRAGRGGRTPSRARAPPPRRRARGCRRDGGCRPGARGGGGRRRPRRARRAGGRAARAARAGARARRRRAAGRRAPPARDGVGAPLVPRLARGRAGATRAGGGAPRRDRRGEAAVPLPDLRGAARPGLDGGVAPAEAAAAALGAAEARMRALALELRAERNAAAPAFADAVAAELRDVGMGEGEFVCELGERDLGATGADEAVFLIRPNSGLPFGPLAETASGGELSRVALAIAAVAGGETLVFDEIDAGIGGETANAVGRVLQRLAERAQVITITHLPQIAALADRHFRVEKVDGDPTHTRIDVLDEGERRAELERMLGGQEFLATIGG